MSGESEDGNKSRKCEMESREKSGRFGRKKKGGEREMARGEKKIYKIREREGGKMRMGRKRENCNDYTVLIIH